MGLNLPKANAGYDGPDVEDGLGVARFEDIKERTVEAFITESDNFGHPDDGRRVDFIFSIGEQAQDGTCQIVYREDGDAAEARQAKSCKPGATGPKSNFREYLSSILTAGEFAAWEADEPFDGDKVMGRWFNVKWGHSKSGYPQVEAVIGPVKIKGSK